MYINILKKLNKCRDYKQDINIKELINIIELNPDSILLDVRSPQEFMENHLKRSNKYTFV